METRPRCVDNSNRRVSCVWPIHKLIPTYHQSHSTTDCGPGPTGTGGTRNRGLLVVAAQALRQVQHRLVVGTPNADLTVPRVGARASLIPSVRTATPEGL